MLLGICDIFIREGPLSCHTCFDTCPHFAVSSEGNGHLQQAMATDVLFELAAIVSADESWYKLIPILGLMFLFLAVLQF